MFNPSRGSTAPTDVALYRTRAVGRSRSVNETNHLILHSGSGGGRGCIKAAAADDGTQGQGDGGRGSSKALPLNQSICMHVTMVQGDCFVAARLANIT